MQSQRKPKASQAKAAQGPRTGGCNRWSGVWLNWAWLGRVRGFGSIIMNLSCEGLILPIIPIIPIIPTFVSSRFIIVAQASHHSSTRSLITSQGTLLSDAIIAMAKLPQTQGTLHHFTTLGEFAQRSQGPPALQHNLTPGNAVYPEVTGIDRMSSPVSDMPSVFSYTVCSSGTQSPGCTYGLKAWLAAA